MNGLNVRELEAKREMCRQAQVNARVDLDHKALAAAAEQLIEIALKRLQRESP